MKINDSDLFFTCSLIELIGRSTKQKRSAVVALLGEKILSHIYSNAGVLHCEPIAKNADAFIEMCNIPEGTFDNVADCKYEVPDHWTIGKVFARLIEDVASGNAIETLQEVYLSPVCDAISNYNSDFFYQPRGFIKEFYLDECKNSPKKRKTPALRFAGFTDAWEQRELGKTCVITTGGTPTTSISNYWNPKEIPWLSSGEVHKKRISETDDRISRQGLENSSARWVKPYSVLIALAGQGKTRGTVAINEIALTTNQSIAAIYPEEHDAEFLFQNLESRYEELRAISSADGSRGGLNKNLLSSVFIPYTETQEQLKIGFFFKFLDRLITLHQREYFFTRTRKNLKPTSKKTNAWEQREFEKSFSLLQNNTLSRSDLSDSPGVAVNIHYGDVLIKFGEYLDMMEETFPWIKKQSDADKFRMSFLQDGDIVFADTAEDETAGKCCEIRNCSHTAIISGLHTIPCRPESKFAPGYLGYYLNSTAFHEQLIPLMQGTKVVSISKTALKSTTIQYPSDYKEQQKIGMFFRGLDCLITLHQRERLFLILEEILC